MSQAQVRVFRMSQDDYSRIQEQEDAERRQRNIDEARRRAAVPARKQSRIFTPKVERSFEELQAYVNAVLTRQDIRDASDHARKYARTVQLVQGGGPGLGHRH